MADGGFKIDQTKASADIDCACTEAVSGAPTPPHLGAKSPLRKLVVKIGSSTLTRADGSADEDYLRNLASQVSRVREAGWGVVIVSSGAIAIGLNKLGISERPTDMPSLQAAASVGQGELAAAYASAFGEFGIVTSLVLLTRRDTADRGAYLHARDTLDRLLELGIVPVVNENDTVSVEQIRFGDNDTLSALVSCLIKADLDIILSDIDGFYDANPSCNPEAKLVSRIDHIDKDVIAAAGSAGSSVGSGGMVTKIRAARALAVAGIPLVICTGERPDGIVDAAAGKDVGTIFPAGHKPHEINPRKLWIALGDSSRGRLAVDTGAKNALVNRGSSLLSVGVAQVSGSFDAGDVVDIVDGDGYLFARGLVSVESDRVELAVGKTHEELSRNRILAELADKPLVHRDDMVVFE